METITVTMNLQDHFLGDILVTAFDGNYGGCWYWAKPGNDNWLETNGDKDILNVVWQRVCIKEHEPSELHEGQVAYVDHETLAKGIRRILSGEAGIEVDALHGAVVEDDAGQIDSDLADCIVQEGLFEQQVYG